MYLGSLNGFGLCERAGFGAQNCQLVLNLKLKVSTSPRLTQNPCYQLQFFVRSAYYMLPILLSSGNLCFRNDTSLFIRD